ncbi:MAG: hypothetical protein Q9211_004464 [Gyalolechia sp. 1 TL-2023]
MAKAQKPKEKSFPYGPTAVAYQVTAVSASHDRRQTQAFIKGANGVPSILTLVAMAMVLNPRQGTKQTRQFKKEMKKSIADKRHAIEGCARTQPNPPSIALQNKADPEAPESQGTCEERAKKKRNRQSTLGISSLDLQPDANNRDFTPRAIELVQSRFVMFG